MTHGLGVPLLHFVCAEAGLRIAPLEGSWLTASAPSYNLRIVSRLEDWLHRAWFSEIRGYPVWGWLVLFAIVALAIYAVATGVDFGDSCDEYGNCLNEDAP